jgi:hypothetical protein
MGLEIRECVLENFELWLLIVQPRLLLPSVCDLLPCWSESSQLRCSRSINIYSLLLPTVWFISGQGLRALSPAGRVLRSFRSSICAELSVLFTSSTLWETWETALSWTFAISGYTDWERHSAMSGHLLNPEATELIGAALVPGRQTRTNSKVNTAFFLTTFPGMA